MPKQVEYTLKVVTTTGDEYSWYRNRKGAERERKKAIKRPGCIMATITRG